MNIALIGSGGREHALCKKIHESAKSTKIICIPGNAGTAKIAENIDINYLDFNTLLKTLKFHKINFVIVGPEEPLVKGIIDFLRRKRIKAFGPTKYAAQLEGSKAFMKLICKKRNIPTAGYKLCKNKSDIKKFLKKNNLPLVVKADGLAAGKGVTICKTEKQLLKVANEIFLGKFKTSKKLILEEFIEGEEASYFLIVDKNNYKFFGTAQDHKRVKEKDKGSNTGGMGSYSPAPIINKELEKKILNKIIKPTLLELKKQRNPFTGFLYAGLMIKNNEPYLIEYNVRMGDPECQVIMPRLKTDILNILVKAQKNNLKNISIKWKSIKCMTIVLCSKGYPYKYKKNRIIKNLDKVDNKKKILLFHAGTKMKDGSIFSNGGRVLNVTSTGNTFNNIRKDIIKTLKEINWKYGFFRKDIGWRVIKKK